jgi:RNA polymerase sigma-70 factor, ECF subfamily
VVAATADEREQRALAADLADDLDASFERFVLRYQDRLFAFLVTLMGNRSHAEEVAQDTFVSAYGALQRYEPQRRRALSLRAWLFTIGLNKVRNLARRQPALALDEAVLVVASPDHGPEASAEQREAVNVVRSALQDLAPRYRMPVMLRHIEGLTYDEIASVLHQPVGTAKANVHRGLALLRNSEKVGALAPAAT